MHKDNVQENYNPQAICWRAWEVYLYKKKHDEEYFYCKPFRIVWYTHALNWLNCKQEDLR